MLSLLGSFTKSEEICELAIASYKNRQKVITERRDPLAWAKIQEEIGEIYYRLGKESADKDLLEEAFENSENEDEVKKLNTDIAKASQILALSR